MPTSLDPLRRALAERLGQLGDTFDALRERLREAVAGTVGQAVSAAVRDAVRALLGAYPDDLPTPRPAWSSDRARGRWDDRDAPYRDGRSSALLDRADGYDDYGDSDDRDGSLESDEELQPQAARAARWGLAVAVGCEAAAWWLRRRAGRCGALLAVGVGLLGTAAAYVGGAGLAGSVLGLVALAGTVRHGAGALTTLAAP